MILLLNPMKKFKLDQYKPSDLYQEKDEDFFEALEAQLLQAPNARKVVRSPRHLWLKYASVAAAAVLLFFFSRVNWVDTKNDLPSENLSKKQSIVEFDQSELVEYLLDMPIDLYDLYQLDPQLFVDDDLEFLSIYVFN